MYWNTGHPHTNNETQFLYSSKNLLYHAAADVAAQSFQSVVSDSVRPHRWQPTRLSHPWDSPRKNNGVGGHFLLQCMKVKSDSEVAQSCPTLSTPWTAAHRAPPCIGFPGQSTKVGCHCLLRRPKYKTKI